jgi:hypothetical protein
MQFSTFRGNNYHPYLTNVLYGKYIAKDKIIKAGVTQITLSIMEYRLISRHTVIEKVQATEAVSKL